MDDRALLEAIRSIVREEVQAETEPMKVDITSVRADVASVKDDVATMRMEMQEGFERLEASINFAGKDISRLEKRLNEHEDKPHIA